MEFVVRTLKLISLEVVAVACLFAGVPVQAIENIPGKSYHLTTKHGPWMVMVTSFRNVQGDQKTDGLTAEQAAAELVFELREKGIPAYTYSQDAVKGEIDTRDRMGRDDHRIYAARRDMICVLAGNYETIEDGVGQKTLNYIKRFHPRFLKNPKSGAILRADASQRGPLTGAFMTINPLIKPEDVMHKSIDAETKYMNSRSQYPLVDNPHKYTLRVATFAGKSVTPLGNSTYRGKEDRFDQEIHSASGYNVWRAGEDAEQLARFLRRNGSTSKGKQFADADIYDAYVYHDKFQSIVTIGGFDSPDDPRIRTIAQYYGPRLVPDFRLVKQTMSIEEVDRLPKVLTTHTEQLFAPGADPKSATPIQVWTLDLEPEVIAIPRIK
jgi:hypothetical protein